MGPLLSRMHGPKPKQVLASPYVVVDIDVMYVGAFISLK